MLTEWPAGDGVMAGLIRAHAWQETPLGPIDVWPQSLRTNVDTILGMPGPATLWWGPQHVQIYNDAFIAIIRERHPTLLGQTAAAGWGDLFEQLEPLLVAARAGSAMQPRDNLIYVEGPSGPEPLVFDADWSVLRDECGEVAGVLETLTETTQRYSAEAALRESEARYTLLFGSWAQAVWETDSSGVVVTDSPSWRTYTGQTMQEWLGYGWLDAIHPDDRAYAEPQWHEAIAARTLVNAEFRLRSPDGGWRWTNVRAAPVIDAEGAIEKWVGMNIDISAAKQAEAALRDSEERQAFLLKLSDALRPLVDPVDIQAVAARVLGEHLRASRVAYVEVTDTAYVIERDYVGAGIPSMAGRHPIAAFGAGKLADYQDGRTRIVRDTGEDIHNSPSDDANFADFHVRAGIGVPLIKGGKFVATLVVHLDAPHAWTSSEIVLAEETAERTWQAVERASVEAALRISEERYRTLFETIDQGFCTIEMIFDADGQAIDYRVLETNPAFVSHTGLVDAGGRLMSELAPDHEAFWYEIYGRVARNGQSERFEHEAAALGRWYNVYAFRLDGGSPNRVAVLFDDVTARRADAAALRESEARLAAAFESVPVGVAVIGMDGHVVMANPEYRRFLPSGVIPSRDPDNAWRWQAWNAAGDTLDPQDYPGSRAMRGERTVPGQEMLYTDVSGRKIWTRVATVPIRDAEGLITAQASVISDIDALKRNEAALRESEDRKAFLLKLADRMRAEHDAEAVIAVGTRMLGEHFAASRIVFAEIDEAAGVARIREGWTAAGAAEHPLLLQLSDFGGPLLDELRAGRTVRFDDVGSPPYARPDLAALAAIGIKAGLSVPLVVAGRLVVNINVHQDRPRTWHDADVALLEDAAERIWGAVDRARAETALRTSEERLRQFGEASQDILWLRDAGTLQWVYLTPAFETIYGMSRQEAFSGDDFHNWLDMIVDEDRDLALTAIRRLMAGEHATFEYRIRRPSDAAIRWLRNTDFPITNERGDVVMIGGIGHDMTEFREAEMRFRTLVEGMPQLVWRAVDGGEWTWASPQWTDYTGQEAPEHVGWGWLAALHPDDRDVARAAWSHALEDGGFDVEYRIRRAIDGAYRWFQTRAAAVRDQSGEISGWLGTSTDIHELRELQGLQKTLLAELQHRVRNILAVTRSIISRSDDGERDTTDYVQHLQGRIAALARTQVLLTRKAGAGVELEDLIRDELLAQAATDSQFTVDGPDVKLSPKAAEVLTLAIHELATNATKYGAFSRAGGRLVVRWNIEAREGTAWLILRWEESGIPIIDAAPRRRGFGAELISRRIPYELKGHGQFELQPGGLISLIEFPLIPGSSILQTDGAHQ